MAQNFAGKVLAGLAVEQLMVFSPFLIIGVIAYLILVPTTVQDRVILLPAPDGSVGAVVVKTAKDEQVLATAYAGIGASAGGKLVEEETTADKVKSRYSSVLEAQPMRPKSFTVYFKSGSATELDTTSANAFLSIWAELASRPQPEVRVIGHTDTVGELEANDALSKERAATVRDMLIAAGLKAASMEVTGRGERELMVKTADDIDEPLNRRVEISIR